MIGILDRARCRVDWSKIQHPAVVTELEITLNNGEVVTGRPVFWDVEGRRSDKVGKNQDFGTVVVVEMVEEFAETDEAGDTLTYTIVTAENVQSAKISVVKPATKAHKVKTELVAEPDWYDEPVFPATE